MKSIFDREAERYETIVRLANATQETRLALFEEYRRRSAAAFAPTTLRNYAQITDSIRKWCLQNGHNPQPPVDPKS